MAAPRQATGAELRRHGPANGRGAAFAVGPRLLLLDEPFGALDAVTRARLQEQLVELWTHESETVLMVTHGIDEAVLLANHIVVLVKARPIRRSPRWSTSSPSRSTGLATESPGRAGARGDAGAAHVTPHGGLVSAA